MPAIKLLSSRPVKWMGLFGANYRSQVLLGWMGEPKSHRSAHSKLENTRAISEELMACPWAGARSIGFVFGALGA